MILCLTEEERLTECAITKIETHAGGNLRDGDKLIKFLGRELLLSKQPVQLPLTSI